MTTMMQMKHLFWRFWWAGPRREFLKPGLYLWTGERNLRVVPLRRLSGQRPPEIVPFPECNVTYAEDQPEYRPLPCYRRLGREVEIWCCWRFSLRDRLKVLFTGKVWHLVWTFGEPLQPQLIVVDKPDWPEVVVLRKRPFLRRLMSWPRNFVFYWRYLGSLKAAWRQANLIIK